MVFFLFDMFIEWLVLCTIACNFLIIYIYKILKVTLENGKLVQLYFFCKFLFHVYNALLTALILVQLLFGVLCLIALTRK